MTARVHAIDIPEGSLMQPYAQMPGGYADAFMVEVAGPVTLPTLMEAFFQTPLFRLERCVLALCLARPTWRRDVEALAEGRADRFAVWQVEARRSNEVMLAVAGGPIRTWLMVRPGVAGPRCQRAQTQVIFGSAILPKPASQPGNIPNVAPSYRMLDGLHRVYARLLLAAAGRRLQRRVAGAG